MVSLYQKLLRTEGLLNKISPEKLAELKGELLELFVHSAKHRILTLDDFYSTVMPAIHFNQFRTYRDKHRLVGWIAWANLSAEDAKAFQQGNLRMSVETWRSGEQMWFMDFVAPFGHLNRIADDMRERFPDKVAYAPEINDQTGKVRVRKFFGKNFHAI